MLIEFDWDSRKAHANLKKHGVSFDEAKTVFSDLIACIFDDELNSVEEKRELIIGHSISGKMLIVSFTERAQGVIRIISARPTTQRERRDYEKH